MTRNAASPRAPVPPDKRGSEHLANERTFLAWIRTSVALLSLGFLLPPVAVFSPAVDVPGLATGARRALSSGAAGDAMIAVGAVLAIRAAWRYHAVNAQIERGQIAADRWLVLMVAALVAALAAVLILVGRG